MWLALALVLTRAGHAQETSPIPCDLEHPTAVSELAKDLREISGLTTLDQGTLAAIQDEKGKLYPLTGDLYLVSSKRRALVVVGPTGEILAASPLSEAMLPQPEGISFLPNGDLFLASEAAGRKRAVLVRFKYRR